VNLTVLGCALLLAAVACATQDPVAVESCVTTEDCPPGRICTDGVCTPPPTGGVEYCDGSGPPILVGDGITVGQGGSGGDDVCSGQVAERAFRFALCSCESYAASTTLTTDSFDSSVGPYVPGRAGGSVGTNGSFASNGLADVGGSLWVAGAGGMILGADLTAAAHLYDGGGIDGSAAGVTVGRDARVAGDVDLADLSVAGTLTLPAERTLAVSGTQTLGTLARAPVAVAAPCECAPADLVDIASFVETYRTANDNADIDLDPAALAAVAAETTLDLPCGRFFVDAIGTTQPLTLHVSGRTALFVGGDATLRAPFTVLLDAGVELDLFVGGLLTSTALVQLGSADRPAGARLYVGGSGTLELSGGAELGGNVYAPRADLALSAAAEVFGSLFVKSVATAVPLVIHYDEAVQGAGDGCPEPPTLCETCSDCDNQACIDGTCSACMDDGDCCAPLVCSAGACVPVVP
jgi:hypothetical protein